MDDEAIGKLTDAELKLAQDWFKRLTPAPSCPVCQSSNWSFFAHVVTPILMAGANHSELSFRGVAYPHFMVSCNTCGTTQFVNAIKADVLPDPYEKEQQQEKDSKSKAEPQS